MGGIVSSGGDDGTGGQAAIQRASDLWMIDPDTVTAQVEEARRGAPNSNQKFRALHSLYHMTFKPGNRLLMLNTGCVDLLAEELLVTGTDTSHLKLVVGALRNLSLNEETKLPMLRLGVQDPLIAISWLGDGELTVKTMGTILNLTINAHVGVTLLKAGLIELVLHKMQHSEDEQVQVAAGLILFNLTTNKRTEKAAFREDAVSVLKGLLVKKNLLGLAVTITLMLLIGHDRENPLIIFTDRQTNVSQMVRCFEVAISGKPMYGLMWAPDTLVFALATAALYEPSRKKMAKLGLYEMLTRVVDKKCRVLLGDPFTEDVAIELRALLRPILVSMGVMSEAQGKSRNNVTLTGSSLSLFASKVPDQDLETSQSAALRPRRKSLTSGSGRRASVVNDDDGDNDLYGDIRKGVMPF